MIIGYEDIYQLLIPFRHHPVRLDQERSLVRLIDGYARNISKYVGYPNSSSRFFSRAVLCDRGCI